MRILQILSQKELTGAEVYALTLSDWLIEKGHSVFIVSDKLHKTTKASYFSRPIHSSNFKDRLANIFYLRKLIKKQQIQMIHTHSRAAARVAFWARMGLPVGLVNTSHGRQHYSFSKRIFDIYGDRVICVCENIKEGLVKHFKMNFRKLIVIGNPIDPSTPSVASHTPDRSSNKIAWIGRFTGPKGKKLENLLNKTFENLLETNPQLSLDLIGGKLESLSLETQKKFSDLKIKYPHRIHHFEHLDSIERHLKNYNLVIGAGRIALACLMQEVPCFAMGEYKALGLIRPLNFAEHIKSNFGDISTDYIDVEDPPQLISDLLEEALDNTISSLEKKELRKLAFEKFELNLICKRIFEIYESVYFQKLFPKPIPILMYHKIPDAEINSPHRIFVTSKNFENHLRFYRSNGFTTITFEQLDEYRQLKRPLASFPKKPLILTFDDGYVDNLKNAVPLLKKYNFRGVIYLLADSSISHNIWDMKSDRTGTEPKSLLMSIEERKKLIDSPFEIGSHGFRHAKMTEMTYEEAYAELSESKKALELEFNRPIISFAFTYGLTSPELADLSRKAGYRFALNTSSGGFHLEEDPHSIFRVNIFPEESHFSLWKKTSWWYRKYFYWKKKK